MQSSKALQSEQGTAGESPVTEHCGGGCLVAQDCGDEGLDGRGILLVHLQR